MIKLNGHEITPTRFPDRTTQVWKLPVELIKEWYPNGYQYPNVQWWFESEDEFMHLAQLKSLIDAYAQTSVLKIYYLPYARQDKAVKNDRTFALHSFARLLNSLEFSQVQILDPHSEMAQELINNCRVISAAEPLLHTANRWKPDLVFYPDYSAYIKYHNYLSHITDFSGNKQRDPATGEITKYGFDTHICLTGKKIMVVDDICDGGSTFIHAAKALKDHGAGDLYLYVTYGIFSKGMRILSEDYKDIHAQVNLKALR